MNITEKIDMFLNEKEVTLNKIEDGQKLKIGDTPVRADGSVYDFGEQQKTITQGVVCIEDNMIKITQFFIGLKEPVIIWLSKKDLNVINSLKI